MRILLIAHPSRQDIVDVLEHSGFHVTVQPDLSAASAERSLLDFHAFVVALTNQSDTFAASVQLMSKTNEAPVITVVEPADVDSAIVHALDFSDFVLASAVERELRPRLLALNTRQRARTSPDIIDYAGLQLNTLTYQVTVHGKPLDMTYMEYELLRHFVTNPGRAHTREELLNRVWGYEYYGGARTVDVHVRRLRAKLGDEHGHLITTVRSVGYCFGEEVTSDAGSPGAAESGEPRDTFDLE